MIIAKIMGGLGNQFFGYALGSTVAGRLGEPLKLDLDDLGPRAKRVLGLDDWLPEYVRANRREIDHLAWGRTWWNRAWTPRKRPGPHYVAEAGPWHYDPSRLPNVGPAYLRGFWQCERYFAADEARLRRELAYRGPRVAADEVMARELRTGDAVAIHVRRGDYWVDEATRRHHGVLGADYYRAAKSRMRQRFPAARFYWFSDDPEWVREQAGLATGDRIVSDGKRSASVELWLMSSCRHYIVANSTYSWWGAWLGRTAGNVTLSPREWMRDEKSMPVDTIPDWWERLPFSP